MFVCYTKKKMPKNAENAEKYFCEKCNFVCSKKSNFTAHLSTLKHEIRTSTKSQTNEKNAEMKKHECPCGKYYISKDSNNFAESFEKAVGISLERFYQLFEAARPSLKIGTS